MPTTSATAAREILTGLHDVMASKASAQAKLNKLLVDRDADRLVMPSRVTLAQYLEQWKEKALKGRVAPRTFKTYEDNLNRYIIPALGDKKLTAITAWDIQGVYSSMTERGLSAGRSVLSADWGFAGESAGRFSARRLP